MHNAVIHRGRLHRMWCNGMPRGVAQRRALCYVAFHCERGFILPHVAAKTTPNNVARRPIITWMIVLPVWQAVSHLIHNFRYLQLFADICNFLEISLIQLQISVIEFQISIILWVLQISLIKWRYL